MEAEKALQGAQETIDRMLHYVDEQIDNKTIPIDVASRLKQLINDLAAYIPPAGTLLAKRQSKRIDPAADSQPVAHACKPSLIRSPSVRAPETPVVLEMKKKITSSLGTDEQKVLLIIKRHEQPMKLAEIVAATGLSEPHTKKALSTLRDKNHIGVRASTAGGVEYYAK